MIAGDYAMAIDNVLELSVAETPVVLRAATIHGAAIALLVA